MQELDSPPVEIDSVMATVDLDADNRPIRASLEDGTAQVQSTSSFTIRFNRFLLPGVAVRQSLCVRADLTEVTKFEDCGGVFLEPTYDPIRREITYRQSATEPRLLPGTKYKLTVLAPDPTSVVAGGIRAFDGAPLASSRSFEFTTVAMDHANATLEALPTGDLFCTTKAACVASCMASMTAVDCEATCPESVEATLRTCAFGSCHKEVRDPTGALQVAAAMGLDLGSAEAIQATAINKVAHQAQQGEHGNVIDRNPLRFGRGMPIIDVGTLGEAGASPGNSYLLYKLAVGRSTTGEAAPDPEEAARLRATVVVGLSMPPEQATIIPQEVDLTNLVNWIAQGAPTPVCPQP